MSPLKEEHFLGGGGEGELVAEEEVRKDWPYCCYLKMKGPCEKECIYSLGAERSSWMAASKETGTF